MARVEPQRLSKKKVCIFTYKFIGNIDLVGKPCRKQSFGKRSREW